MWSEIWTRDLQTTTQCCPLYQHPRHKTVV